MQLRAPHETSRTNGEDVDPFVLRLHAVDAFALKVLSVIAISGAAGDPHLAISPTRA